MTPLNRIVCAVDFSDASRRALEYALALARWYEAELTVVHIFSDRPAVDIIPSLGVGGMAPSSATGPARTPELEHELKRFVSHSGARHVDVDVRAIEAADARQEILVQAELLRADLLVLGTHGRAGFQHLVLGSVAEHVLRKAALPIMVVPPGVNSPPVSSEIHLKRFVCAVDFSESSLSALAYALSLAEESDGELDMIHVIELAPETVEAAVAAHFDLARVRAKAEATIRARLESLIPESTRACCTVNTTVAEGRVASTIVALARDRGSDVIVMGVHGRGALDLALFGSKTHEVIRRAGVPVLTVRSGR